MAKAPGEAMKRGRGRPPILAEGKGAESRFGIRVSGELERRVDNWRKAQPDKPAQSEALRRLLESALKAAGF